jgi:hypothetical protein
VATVNNAAPPASGQQRRMGGDRVGWAIAIVSALIAAAQFAYQLLGPHP